MAEKDEGVDLFRLTQTASKAAAPYVWQVAWVHVESMVPIVRRLTQEEYERFVVPFQPPGEKKPYWGRAEIEAIGVPDEEAG